MIRRLALTAGFAVLGAVAFAPKAHAQAAPTDEMMVPFEGTVGSVCTLSNPQTGTLGVLDDATLDSEATGGESGAITVNCTGTNQISVGAPLPDEVPDFTPTTLTATVSESDTKTTSDTAPPFEATPGGDVDLKVDMVVGSVTALPPGTYKYNVEVTATPN